MSSSVVRMIDRAPVAVGSHEEMADWLKSWADSFAQGDYGRFRSIVVLLEGEDGELATIAQSFGAMDRTRVIGLLMTAAHRKLDGCAEIDALEKQA